MIELPMGQNEFIICVDLRTSSVKDKLEKWLDYPTTLSGFIYKVAIFY